MKEIVKNLISKGILIEPQALIFLKKINDIDPKLLTRIVEIYLSKHPEKRIKTEDIQRNLSEIILILKNIHEKDKENKEKIELIEKLFDVKPTEAYKEGGAEKKSGVISSNKASNLRILSSYHIQGKNIEVKDFVTHFRNRYIFMKSLLQENRGLNNLTSIDKCSKDRQNVSIIAMVLKKRITKNKNIILEVEDLTGRVSVLINSSKQELFEKSKDIVEDDILGFSCSGSREILFANNVFFPDAFANPKNFSDKDEYLAVISDIHTGSSRFLEENFLKFISWLNGTKGNESQKELAKKVKYLFIVGDTIDGVGIYPGQEELLKIQELGAQYQKLYELLSQIRKDVEIVLCPGQHDSVRVAEPQPPLNCNHATQLYSLPNMTFVSNPALVEIVNKSENGRILDGLKVLMYHGASFHGFVDNIEELRLSKAHDTPSKIVRQILKRRHLAPMHSDVSYIPYEKEDPLVIKEIPDLILTGEIHKVDIDNYNGINIICSSCWQSITPFEEKVGNHPDPCKVPLFNLKTQKVQIIDFS